jgi:hypothetical protein
MRNNSGALGSVGLERVLHTHEVTGSIPVAPTNNAISHDEMKSANGIANSNDAFCNVPRLSPLGTLTCKRRVLCPRRGQRKAQVEIHRLLSETRCARGNTQLR